MGAACVDMHTWDPIGGSSLLFLIFGGLVGVVTRPKEDCLSAATAVDQLLRSLRRAFRSPGGLPAPKSRDRNDYPSDQARKAGPADPALEISIMNTAPMGGLARDGSHSIGSGSKLSPACAKISE